MNLYSYPFTDGISGLAAGGASAIQGEPENDDRVTSGIHSGAVTKCVWRCNWRP